MFPLRVPGCTLAWSGTAATRCRSRSATWSWYGRRWNEHPRPRSAYTWRLTARLAELLGGGGGGGTATGGGRAGPDGHLGAGEGRALGRTPVGAAGDLISEFSAALDDDLDTPRAVRALRAAVRRRDGAAAAWMASILRGNASLT